ncbi:hypothetical protein [Pseudonocardia sp. GCM10023141]|uniref:hypothetical protein n=1 Tax=Pseudonocardia sp. GCM10023141 TaxID=3252653 RepID=UPI00361DF5AD
MKITTIGRSVAGLAVLAGLTLLTGCDAPGQTVVSGSPRAAAQSEPAGQTAGTPGKDGTSSSSSTSGSTGSTGSTSSTGGTDAFCTSFAGVLGTSVDGLGDLLSGATPSLDASKYEAKLREGFAAVVAAAPADIKNDVAALLDAGLSGASSTSALSAASDRVGQYWATHCLGDLTSLTGIEGLDGLKNMQGLDGVAKGLEGLKGIEGLDGVAKELQGLADQFPQTRGSGS